jgi:Cgr1 family
MTATTIEKPKKVGDAFAVPEQTRGRNVSGRNWKKVATKRTSSLVKAAFNNQTKSYEQRRADKLRRKEVLELQKQLQEERVQAIRDKKERRLENERRRAENEYEHAKKLAQQLNTSKLKSTMKTMSKKQLRQIKKTRVNNKTGAVEFVPAYSK